MQCYISSAIRRHSVHSGTDSISSADDYVLTDTLVTMIKKMQRAVLVIEMLNRKICHIIGDKGKASLKALGFRVQKNKHVLENLLTVFHNEIVKCIKAKTKSCVIPEIIRS
jgi:hypothetical protein